MANASFLPQRASLLEPQRSRLLAKTLADQWFSSLSPERRGQVSGVGIQRPPPMPDPRFDPADPNIASRGTILPIGRTQSGEMSLAAPQIALDMFGSAQLPSAVLKGYDPTFEDTAQMSMDTMMAGGLLSRAPAGALGANVWHGSPRRAYDEAMEIRRNLPLTGAQRGELLNLYETKTLKSKPRNAVNDLVRNEYWPEELRSEGIEFLQRKGVFHGLRRRMSSDDQKPDPLASREPEHAIRKFEAKKRHQLEEEARRSNEAAIRERGEALQGLDEEGLWNKKAVGEIASWMNPIERMGIGHLQRAIARANMEAVPRALQKEGWTIRHASKGRDKRRSSRYVVSPDGKFEVRLSDHYLPDTPEREYMRSQTGGPRWDEDIVVSGTESPRSIIDEIKGIWDQDVLDRAKVLVD
jgi:hypothetical protein